MIEAGIEGIEFLVANTDLQALKRSRAPIKIQLGSRLTKGLGAGADPGVGREAALEDTDKIIEVLEGEKRPVAAVADHDEARDVRRVEVLSDKTISMRMLFDPGHSLEERILREQFGH